MAQPQIAVNCSCGKVEKKYSDPLSSDPSVVFECEKCGFGLYLRAEGTLPYFPPIVTYSAQTKSGGVWSAGASLFESFRRSAEMAWLESKQRIPKMTADEALSGYLWRCVKTKKLFSDPQFIGLILEIAINTIKLNFDNNFVVGKDDNMSMGCTGIKNFPSALARLHGFKNIIQIF